MNDYVRIPHALWLAAALGLAAGAAVAEVYKDDDGFLRETFGDDVPAPSALWLTGALKDEVSAILGHDYPALRLRYWARGERSAWILEEIGKEEPITVGIVIDAGRLAHLEVLAFRESRGGEVRYPWFTRQFEGARLQADRGLDLDIDGITGATLSVRALQRLARLALYLDQRVHAADEPPTP